MLLCQGSCVGSNPTGRFYFSVWESLEIRVPRAHENVGSNPATLTDVMRWVLCWYGKVRLGGLIAATQIRFLPPQLDAIGSHPAG